MVKFMQAVILLNCTYIPFSNEKPVKPTLLLQFENLIRRKFSYKSHFISIYVKYIRSTLNLLQCTTAKYINKSYT